ncbi:MAG: mercuric transport protein [Gemmatimonadales bacterium]|nr:mercuric transport protein [Gemmatimonadales bacterium]
MRQAFGTARTSVAAVGAAFLASLCCIGPVLFVTLGVGAGLASRFEPLRPVFTVISIGLLALGFYTVYGRRPAGDAGASCDIDGGCAVARNRTRGTVLLWGATLVTLIVLTFPQWSKFLV